MEYNHSQNSYNRRNQGTIDTWWSLIVLNHIVGVMVSVLASSAVDRGLNSRSGKKKKKLVFVASPLSTQQ